MKASNKGETLAASSLQVVSMHIMPYFILHLSLKGSLTDCFLKEFEVGHYHRQGAQSGFRVR